MSCAAVLPGKTGPPVPVLHPGRRGGYKIMRTLKYDVKKLWKSETKKKRALLNKKIAFVDTQLASIHAAGKAKEQPRRIIESRKLLTAELANLRTSLNPPKTVRALPAKKRGECMSRKFWARAFPQKRGASNISEFNVVHDWENPPEKNSETEESTEDIGTLPRRRQNTLHISEASAQGQRKLTRQPRRCSIS